MSKRTRTNIFSLLTIAVFLFNFERVTAQQVSLSQDGQKTVRAASSGESGQEGRVSIKLERGGHVAVDNRTTGRIRITGWDKDTVEATATSERGVEAVRFNVKDSPDKFIWLKADYMKREEDETPRPEPTPMPQVTPTAPSPSAAPGILTPSIERLKQILKPDGSKSDIVNDPPMRDGRPIEVHLEVFVPRYAEIELIKVIRSRVEVTNVETSIVVLGNKSDVILKNVGEGEVRTNSGSVEIEDAAGLVEVVTSSGAVRVRRAGGDVRVISISGNVEIDCVRGHVNVDTAGGSIALSNVQGDVEASASNSNVRFTGAIREDGRYHLKTMSGVVEMAVRDKPPGFTAALSSYRGTIENDFQLQIKQTREQHTEGEVNRRVVGRHGDGQAQITLDTFDGKVKLGKLATSDIKECKIKN